MTEDDVHDTVLREKKKEASNGMAKFHFVHTHKVLPGGSVGKQSACNAGDPGSIPGWGRSPGGRNGNPLQYSCLENPMDREPWLGVQSMGLPRVRHGLATKPLKPHTHTNTHAQIKDTL